MDNSRPDSKTGWWCRWLVVSLMKRGAFDEFRRAEMTLAAVPPGVQEIVKAAVAGTASTFRTESDFERPPGK